MIVVDLTRCTGCGLCEKDCVARTIIVKDGKARFLDRNCMRCFHCLAICPVQAISTDDPAMVDTKEYDPGRFSIDPERFLNFLKFRRSVRLYTEDQVEKEKIQLLIEAGRYSPTGHNSQNVSYLVIQDDVRPLTELALKSLYDQALQIAGDAGQHSDQQLKFANRWQKMYTDYIKDPNARENLFHNAKTIILIISDSLLDGSLAACNMEMMASTLGLGACHIGYFLYAARGNAKLMNFLGLDKSQNIAGCLIVGYPAVQYQRTVPRNKPRITWR